MAFTSFSRGQTAPIWLPGPGLALTPVREIQSIPTLIVRTLANSLSDVNLILETTHVSRHLKDTISMAMSIIDITSNDIAASTALLMGELSCALSMLSTDGRHLLETCGARIVRRALN